VQLQEGHLAAGQAEVLDRAGVAVRLGDLRRIHFVREPARHPGNLVADVIRRLVDVAAHGKLDGDVGTAVTAAGVDRGNTLDTVDLILDELGDLGFDNLRRGPGIAGADGHDGRAGVGILAQRQLHEGERPENHQHQTDHGGEYGTFYGNIGKYHLVTRKAELREI